MVPIFRTDADDTFFPIGGSHYLLLDEISQNLHQHGHDVRMLLQLGNPVITGTNMEKYSILCIAL